MGATSATPYITRPFESALAALLRLIGCVALMAVSHGAFADSLRQITWQDLQPAIPPEVEKRANAATLEFRALPAPIRNQMRKIMRELFNHAETKAADVDGPTDFEISLINKALGPEDAAAGLAFWTGLRAVRAEITRIEAKVDPTLDGQSIRMPGYMLPLEFEGEVVSEFLLVPTVGACIHVPPPPENQIVHVSVSEGITSTGLFSPVWITGTIRAQFSQPVLSLVDGSAPIDVGYTMSDAVVEPYKKPGR